MKTSNRRHSTLFSVLLCLACLTATFIVSQTSQPAQARTEADKNQPARPLAPVGSGFTYQGQLKDGGLPANGSYDLQFTLFDALTNGNRVGTTRTLLAVTVSEGLFTVTLDFGATAFQGQARYLEIAVRLATAGRVEGGYTTLSPRQPLTATPYAASLMPGAVITGTLVEPALAVTNTGGTGVFGSSASGTRFGVWGVNTSSSGYGVYGVNNTNSTQARGVVGISNVGNGVSGLSTSGLGVFGSSVNQHGGLFTNNSTTGYAALQGIASGTPGYGVYGEGNSVGVWGTTTNGTGVGGSTTSGYGVHGYSFGSGTGVRGESSSGTGIYGISTNSTGVSGQSTSYVGVEGVSSSGYGLRGYGFTGVWGHGNGGAGVAGEGINNGVGVFGGGRFGVQGSSAFSDGVNGWSGLGNGVYGTSEDGWAGWFDGNVNVTGGCCAAAAGSFKIDHPLDPENKYLVQSAVQSADMMGIYNGNVTLDAKGEATVTMPDWFDALNKEFRYQLTAIGAPGPNLYVAEEVANNRFKIAGGKSGTKVSWQVTGIRKDPYAEKNRIPVEEDKPADEKGKYLYPTVYGQPENKGLDYERKQRSKQRPNNVQQPKSAEELVTTGR